MQRATTRNARGVRVGDVFIRCGPLSGKRLDPPGTTCMALAKEHVPSMRTTRVLVEWTSPQGGAGVTWIDGLEQVRIRDAYRKPQAPEATHA